MVSTCRTAVALGAAALALCAGTPAFARKSTIQIPIKVKVEAGCRVSTTDMIFLVFPPFTNTKADSTATVTVTCLPNTDYTIDIDRGLYSNGINRRMYSVTADAYFDYDIYKDPPRSQVWGTGQTQNLPGNSGTTGIVNYTVYGRTQQMTKLKAGQYKDHLTVTVNF